MVPPTRWRTVFIVALAWFLPCPLWAIQSDSSTAVTDSTPNPATLLVAQANNLAQKLFDNRKALALYSEALALESMNADILWRMSRSYVDIGDHLSATTDEDKEEQLAMYERAFEYADRAIQADAQNSMAYTRRAVAWNRVALFKGLWESVGLMKDIKGDLEKALALDSTNHLAYYAMGEMHMRVTERPWIFRWPLGLGWGSKPEAIRNFEKAIDLRPDFIKYRLACARAYVDEGEYDEARAHLLLIPLLPSQDEDDESNRKRATELFEIIKDEEE